MTSSTQRQTPCPFTIVIGPARILIHHIKGLIPLYIKVHVSRSFSYRVSALQDYAILSSQLHSVEMSANLFKYVCLSLSLYLALNGNLVHGSPAGAPRLACGDMTPQHGVDPQTSVSPFVTTPSSVRIFPYYPNSSKSIYRKDFYMIFLFIFFYYNMPFHFFHISNHLKYFVFYILYIFLSC